MVACGAATVAATFPLGFGRAVQTRTDDRTGRLPHPVRGFAGEAMDPKTILSTPCDVLVPAAIGNVIDAATAEHIEAKYVVEAANGPTTPEGDAVLRKRGITVLPDIYTNGGVWRSTPSRDEGYPPIPSVSREVSIAIGADKDVTLDQHSIILMMILETASPRSFHAPPPACTRGQACLRPRRRECSCRHLRAQLYKAACHRQPRHWQNSSLPSLAGMLRHSACAGCMLWRLLLGAAICPVLRAVAGAAGACVLCAGGVTVSFFEWVQNLQNFRWEEDEVNKRLDR